jgi:tight adherence protein C
MTVLMAASLSGMLLLLGLSGTLLLRAARQHDLERRVVRALNGDDPRATPHAWLAGGLHALGEQYRRFYSPGHLDHMRGMIVASGFNPHRVLPVLLGGKLLLMLLLPVLAVAIAACLVDSMSLRFLVIGAGVIAGIIGPDSLLGVMRRRYVAALEQGTPDALDLLVICSEAGMGLEGALDRVSQEMQPSNRAIAGALSSLLDDLRVLPNQRDAFLNLGTRSGGDGLRRVGAMLGQSLRYGTPLSNALRAVAQEIRQERTNKLEEKAVKLPARLVFPMIFFIMPSLYIILLGPSFIPLYDSLKIIAGIHT